MSQAEMETKNKYDEKVLLFMKKSDIVNSCWKFQLSDFARQCLLSSSVILSKRI